MTKETTEIEAIRDFVRIELDRSPKEHLTKLLSWLLNNETNEEITYDIYSLQISPDNLILFNDIYPEDSPITLDRTELVCVIEELLVL